MPQFVTGSFNTMDPRLLSPVQAALSSMGQMNRNLMGIQQARQAGIETQFMPQMLHAQIASRLAPGLISAGQQAFVNPQFLQAIEQLYKGTGVAMPESQPGTVSHTTAPGDQISSADMAQHQIAQKAGLTHPGVGHHASAQSSALTQLLGMLPDLENKAEQYGGPLGFLESLGRSAGAQQYDSLINTATRLAHEGGVSPNFLSRTMSAENTSKAMDNMQDSLRKILKNKQQIAKASATGQLLTDEPKITHTPSEEEPQFKAGTEKTLGGVTYVFDGTGWKIK